MTSSWPRESCAGHYRRRRDDGDSCESRRTAHPDFIDELRRSGYAIGVEQYVLVQSLLLALAVLRGELPHDPRRLGTLLRPVLCKSPQEQEDFRSHFDHWVGFTEPLPGRPMRPG